MPMFDQVLLCVKSLSSVRIICFYLEMRSQVYTVSSQSVFVGGLVWCI